jgi:hypothetical protein
MDSPEAPGAFLRVNGARISVDIGASFIETVKTEARKAGLGKFRTYLNGSEIKPSQAPDTIDEGMMVEVRPYDVAG